MKFNSFKYLHFVFSNDDICNLAEKFPFKWWKKWKYVILMCLLHFSFLAKRTISVGAETMYFLCIHIAVTFLSERRQFFIPHVRLQLSDLS